MSSKVLKIVSLIAFLILLSPTNFFYLMLFIAASAVFVPVFIRKSNYINADISTISLLMSILVNLILSVIFLHRWGFIIGTTPALMVSIVLAVVGVWALPGILASYKFTVIDSTNIKEVKFDLRDLLICLLASLAVMLIATRSTPLIPYNDYCDANVMFTIGRGMTQGKVPYRDLIDHKGPVILIIHALGALISSKTFTGVWLFEWLSCFGTMLLGIKIHNLLSGKSDLLSRILFVPLTVSLYFTFSFLYGDNAEAFCVPLVLFGLYIGIKSFLTKQLTSKDIYLTGIAIGLIFWMKFTLCGAFVGMFLFFVGYSIKKKYFELIFKTVFMLLAGLITVTIPILIYFAVNGSVDYLLQVYIFNNIFSYNLNSESGSLLSSLIMPLNMLGYYMGKNYFMLILTSIALIYFNRKNRLLFLFVLSSFTTCFVFAFVGSKSYTYYAFIITAFAVTGWSGVILLFRYLLNNIKIKIPHIAVVILSSILLITATVTECPNWEILWLKLEDSPVYEISQIIQQSQDPTLICYGFQDRGFYTYNDIVPDVPYFTLMNMNADITLGEQERYIQEGQYEFIITENEPHDFEGYELVFTDPNEGEGLTYYLYQRVS